MNENIGDKIEENIGKNISENIDEKNCKNSCDVYFQNGCFWVTLYFGKNTQNLMKKKVALQIM